MKCLLEPGFLEGYVVHKRYQPQPNSYTIRQVWVCIDVDALEHFGEGLEHWSLGNGGQHSLSRDRFIGEPHESIREAINRTCREHGIEGHFGPMRAIAAGRNFGMGANPAQFYLVHNVQSTLVSIIVSLTNRSNETFHYVFQVVDENNLNFKSEKALFISPHTPMDMEYRWEFYVGHRHFMTRLHIEWPDDPEANQVNRLLFPVKARRDAQKKRFMDIIFTTTHRPFTKKISRDLAQKYLFSSLRQFFSRTWTKLLLNQNGRPFPHPGTQGEEHPRPINPPVNTPKARRKL